MPLKPTKKQLPDIEFPGCEFKEESMRLLAITIVATLLSLPAYAHSGIGETAGFLHGFAHPIGGLDHILAMIAVGVFAFVLGGRALWLIPLSFIGMMVFGFMLGIGRLDLPFVELGIAASSIAIGATAAWGRSIPITAAMALVGAFAVFHGHAHGTEMPVTTSGVEYAAGFVLATVFLNIAGIATASGLALIAGKYGQPIARMTGSALAVGGLGLLMGLY